MRTLLPLCLVLSCSLPVLGQSADIPDKQDTKARPPVVLSDKARELHKHSIVIDGHNDLPYKLRDQAGSSLEKLDVSQPQKKLHTDIERMRLGGVGGQFWAAYVPSDTIKAGNAARFCLEQIDLIHRLAARYPDTFQMAYTADDIVRIHKSGKIASLIGIEGGHAIEESLAVLRMFHKLGARYMTLTHSDTLSWADAATDTARSGGLSPFGQEVVLEMNRLGMMVDLSHVSADCMRHVIRITEVPVIFSHSSSYTLAPHPRNVPDDVLALLKKNGGLVMVNFYSGFIVPEGAKRMTRLLEVRRELREKHKDDAEYKKAVDKWFDDNPIPPGNVHTVVDHIEHIIKTAGIDHVGLGSDYDGISQTPGQLEDVSGYPYITQELLNRGYSEADIKKVLGENLLRVMRKAEAAAGK